MSINYIAGINSFLKEITYIPNSSIKQWAEEDRPREKLLIKGRSALSEAELIAIIIGSGYKEKTAVDVAREILISSDNNLNALGQLSVNDFMKFKGIGEAKAISIIAALELGRRRDKSEAIDKKIFRLSGDSYEYFAPVLADLDHEEFWVIFLKRNNSFIKMEQLSSGGITGTVADIRMIMKRALELRATSIVLAHNHPSGGLEPSHADRKLTEKIQNGGKVMDIHLVDHLIISHKGYYSFADKKLL